MNFAAYGELLRDVRLRRLLGVGFVARFPHSAAGIILTLHVAVTLGLGYGAAGLAAAALTLGIAIGAPWRGRQVDQVGLRRALIPSVIAEAVVWSVVPFLPMPWMLIGVFIGGVFALPVFSVVRTSLGVLTRGDQRQTAFALDSIITETIFMMGPALGAVVATVWSSQWGLAIVGWSTALAGLYLMWFNPPTRSSQVMTPSRPGDYTAEDDLDQAVANATLGAPAHLDQAVTELHTGAIPLITPEAITGSLPVVRQDPDDGVSPARVSWGARLRRQFSWLDGPVAAILLVSMASGILMVGTEVSIVAELEAVGRSGEVGIVYAFWCGASAIGGLLYGAMSRHVSPLLLMGLFALATLPLALVEGTWPLAFVSLLSGLFTAPTLAAASSQLTSLVPEERRGEVMGYYGSALTAGAALGAPVAGVFIDSIAPEAGYVFAAALSLLLVGVAVLVGVLGRRRAGRGVRA